MRIHFLEKIALLSRSYMACDVYHTAGRALTALGPVGGAGHDSSLGP